jgi:hypothetical protein
MTDRELWVKTWKTVGAMVGGTVVFLGSVTLFLLLAVGRSSAAPATETQASPTAPALPNGAKAVEGNTPPVAKPGRHGNMTSARPGESI